MGLKHFLTDHPALCAAIAATGSVTIVLLIHSKFLSKSDAEAQQQPSYTMEEVSQHASEDDLWIVIGSKVYDVTQWQHHHPGGQACVKRVGGKDCSEGFDLFHDEKHYKMLPKYQIGVVNKTVVSASSPVAGSPKAGTSASGSPVGSNVPQFGEDTPADFMSPLASPASTSARAFTLVESLSISHNTKQLRFESVDPFSPGPPVAPHFQLAPGGHMTYEYSASGGSRRSNRRHYSPIVYIPGDFTFIVKRYEGGSGSSRLHELEVGETAMFSGPKVPTYMLAERIPLGVKRLILVAGGTGIAPIYSLAQSAAREYLGATAAEKEGKPAAPLSILVVSCFRDEDDALLDKEMSQLLEEYSAIGHLAFYTRQETSSNKPRPTTQIPVAQGRISKGVLVDQAKASRCEMDLLSPPLSTSSSDDNSTTMSTTDVVCCGPLPFNQHLKNIFCEELSLPKQSFFTL